ncbi:precorrin-6y C5,15-methyltransferase (decarboxylating) subunit CbiE [Paracoccus sp. (in: a-proteobacteria)]|uniref:precorrin-6y C5,15-methyltransferase (decarboxylating) subunit CbiE n=1 Tax=Paracoccus sp. TaxID=267 RepID=UPI0026E0A020|nr:precorrin-6y C5,15-methyltransferase (decarboxylating) subunit CbiE [Paracoccus sp. (in: a-proteobacteria)]MDO5648579.1 precorrin-6y C5,15-methyltransferase (decarboxylating) subunit CbiE [Paracoccus sp. (in: a-proteobacteria)]
MIDPWVTLIGIGEDGLTGLSDASRTALDAAEIIIGGPRHLALAGAGDRGREWPVPFDVAPVLALRGRAVAVLVSGDPFWFGAGASLTAHLTPGEWVAHPAPSCFSLAAAVMGWAVQNTACAGLHAAPFTRLRPHLTRGCRIIATLRDGNAPRDLAAWLVEQGFGAMQMTVLERLGGPQERRRQTRAKAFDLTDIAAPVVVALNGAELPRGLGLSAAPGRPTAAFHHDGQITKSPIRALTLAALQPRPDALLWDIGGGSGSVSVEWALSGGRAICIEPRADRMANITANCDDFGVAHRVQRITGAAPDALRGLPEPDAVFVGGGGNAAMFDLILSCLPIGARLVANAVTIDTEALLMALHKQHGGDLLRIDIAGSAPLGRMRGWQPARPVVQWALTR